MIKQKFEIEIEVPENEWEERELKEVLNEILPDYSSECTSVKAIK